jgi:TraB/PrgY/gumN family
MGMGRLSVRRDYRTIPSRAPRALAIGLAALLTAAPAQSPDPDGVLLEELVVVAREPGPAFWRVSDADTVVHVLGVPSLAPKQMVWDRMGFERRLRGANVVILPAKGLRVRLAGAPGAAIAYLRLKSRTPYEETLGPEARARFAAARAKLGQPAERYGTKNPLAAGLLLITDYREQWKLTDSDPSKLIRLLAGQAKVKVADKRYDLGPLLGAVAKAPLAGGEACLEAALSEVEAGPRATLAATRAWAEGEVRGALAAERTYERCLASVPGAAAFDARVKADLAAEIAKALKTPGHAIAVVQLRPLLAQGGVLDRLRAQGYDIKTPGDLEDEEP